MMEPVNSANFTIAALLGSSRSQQELIRDTAPFHDQRLRGPERNRLGLNTTMESDEEDEQESRNPGDYCLNINENYCGRKVSIIHSSELIICRLISSALIILSAFDRDIRFIFI